MYLKNYPFLNPDEFAEACHHLDSTYCRARLGPLRNHWKLRVRKALDVAFFVEGGCSTYVQIIRTLERNNDLDLDLDLDLARCSLSGGQIDESVALEDGEMVDAEEADKAAIVTHPARDTEFVAYEIHLHPTYRVPCLWFSIHGLPPHEPAFNIDTVFRLLVPDEYKESLRGMGGVGGISADHHPLTGLPSFFVHPCLLGDAMSNFSCDSKNYLIVWLGLVGGCVGLWVPKEMAIQ
ncbi:hypothetical protein E4U43_001628 [Claviceps pusilla]|uniref:Ubiquitin-like-conjugating enzyme ATG10 n=1 Tax=Claviceps pusilla TaxID=123648 RepID=A0A9P7N7E0_9HYPO|nr:hypothetical protein E4U43_001628 [Claviceps pusilla]